MILDFAVITVFNGDKVFQVLGTVSNTDPRLSDARAPLPHSHNVADIKDFDPAQKEDKANKDKPYGYAGLLPTGLIDGRQLPYGMVDRTVCAGNDPRLADARNPIGPASGDLAGSFPGPTVAGLLGNALPPPAARYGLTRNRAGTGWSWAELVDPDEFRALQAQFRALLLWVVQTFGEIPEGMEDAFEEATAEI